MSDDVGDAVAELQRTPAGSGFRIHEGRIDTPAAGRDDLEHSEANSQVDLEFALLQMRGETLARIDAAVARIDTGTYGRCLDCDGRIPQKRLRALPFALRCQACEGQRERGQAQPRTGRREQLSVRADTIFSS